MRTVGPGEGEMVRFPGLGTRHLIRSEDTEGRFALIEHDIPARALAAPLHTHQREDEYSWVLSGQVGFELGGETLAAGPGELIVKPRGIPHAFWNPGDEEARLLELISPGGFEHYFKELEPLLAPGKPRDFEALGAVQARYGLSMDPTSVERLMKEHGLVG